MTGVSGAGTVARDSAHGRARTKAALLGAVVAGILVFDLGTKLLVQRHLDLYRQVDVIGEYVRLTYIYNPGAAFGISVGPYSRQIFLGLSVVALGALIGMYRYTPAGDRMRLLAIALICGGATGNIIDRVRSQAGVVDFIDIGVGDIRWPIFNIADMAVTAGAIILAISLWSEERRSDGA
jgi:signal peptidase II